MFLFLGSTSLSNHVSRDNNYISDAYEIRGLKNFTAQSFECAAPNSLPREMSYSEQTSNSISGQITLELQAAYMYRGGSHRFNHPHVALTVFA